MRLAGRQRAEFVTLSAGLLWVKRFNAQGLAGVQDKPRSGRKPIHGPEVQVLFLPKYACRLNLIAPWWKQLRSLALKGRRFETVDEVIEALMAALDYWNAHRHPYCWKRRPQIPLLGGFGIGRTELITSI